MGEFGLDGVAMSGADALLSFAPTAPPASDGDEFGRALSRATESARPERRADQRSDQERSAERATAAQSYQSDAEPLQSSATTEDASTRERDASGDEGSSKAPVIAAHEQEEHSEDEDQGDEAPATAVASVLPAEKAANPLPIARAKAGDEQIDEVKAGDKRDASRRSAKATSDAKSAFAQAQAATDANADGEAEKASYELAAEVATVTHGNDAIDASQQAAVANEAMATVAAHLAASGAPSREGGDKLATNVVDEATGVRTVEAMATETSVLAVAAAQANAEPAPAVVRAAAKSTGRAENKRAVANAADGANAAADRGVVAAAALVAADVDATNETDPRAAAEGSSDTSNAIAAAKIDATKTPNVAPSSRSAEIRAARVNGGQATSRVGAGETEAQRMRLIQRVVRAFQSMGDTSGELRLRLSPPSLGSIKIEVTVQAGVMSARVETETTAAKNLLVDSLPALRERLSTHDIKVARFDVELSADTQGGSQQRFAREDSPRGAPARHPRGEATGDGRLPQVAATTTARGTSSNGSLDVFI